MINLPEDVTSWLMGVFRTCNAEASEKLSRVPNAHEPWIDFAVIENLQRASAPYRFESDWLVSIDTHWLGSAPMWPEAFPRWEIADIGFLVMFRSGGTLIRSKVALLQSKRLYPREGRPESEAELRHYYGRGFGRMLPTDQQFAELTESRVFRFNDDSEYSALAKGNAQWQAIEEYEAATQVPVYYLFYNPLRVPCEIEVPHRGAAPRSDNCEAGCRVVPSRILRQVMATDPDGATPSYAKVAQQLPSPFGRVPHIAGWRLEHFVVELLLQCKTGRITDIRTDEGLYRVFNRRTAPIQAAIAVTIDAPAGFDWAVRPDDD
jgi:hypothetical protein